MDTEVIINIKTASIVAVLNAWEDGDRWDKIVGCESCPTEHRVKCCGGNCHLLEKKDATCRLQNESIVRGSISGKSLFCITHPLPSPTDRFSPCPQEFKCVKGSEKILGKIRRVKDKRGELI